MNTKNIGLIIGGSSGMGKESARKLLEKGESVWLVARNVEKLKKTRDEFQSEFSDLEVRISLVNLYNEKEVSIFIEGLKSCSDHISSLINAAGYFKPVTFLEHTHSDYDTQIDLNKAFFFITQAVAKNMSVNGGGNIVNIGSMWAHQAIKATPSSAYSMQKAGLHSLTQHLAMELAEHGVRVNAVAPAVVLSTIYKSFIELDKIDEALKDFNSFHPIGRIGKLEDIADAVDFLLSDKSNWITGEILNVDGGVMAGRN